MMEKLKKDLADLDPCPTCPLKAALKAMLIKYTEGLYFNCVPATILTELKKLLEG